MQISFVDVVGFVMSVIMGFFLKEIRMLNSERKKDMDFLAEKRAELRKDLEQKGAELKKHLEEDFMPIDTHVSLCKIANLEMRDFVKETIYESEKRIIVAIKNNGGYK